MFVGSSSSSTIRIAEQRLSQQYAHFLAALQFAHFPLMKILGNIQSIQQDRGIDFGGIPAFVANDAFELAKPHAVLIGKSCMIFGIQDFAFLQGVPQCGHCP